MLVSTPLKNPLFALALVSWTLLGRASEAPLRDQTLFSENFSGFRSGPISGVVGAQLEYHYLPEAAPKGAWEVSTFVSGPPSERAWKVMERGSTPVMVQTLQNPHRHTHPMLVTGDPLWGDYTVEARFAPQSEQGRGGFVFRYRNDRCYYFFGVEGSKAVLLMVRHAAAFHQPFEVVLGEREFDRKAGDVLIGRVSVRGSEISAGFGDDTFFTVEDSTYPTGRIGLTSDVPTDFYSVEVRTSKEELARFEAARDAGNEEERSLQEANPKPVLWKKIRMEGVLRGRSKTRDFGVGRNLRFGDLDGDGTLDVLIGQVLHHGPKDRNSEIGCLTAMTFDGEILWQLGVPDQWKNFLTNDVAFQIHDLDGDGRNEVVYCRDMKIAVAEGATGKTLFTVDTPEVPPGTKPPYNRFPRILGDALFFCDFRGTGRDADVVLKDRYQHFWVFDDKLQLQWKGSCNTGHYPFAHDVDGDGRDELSIGYSLYDDDGTRLWTLEDSIVDHADGVAIADFSQSGTHELRLLCAASDEGMFFSDMKGNVLKHHYIGHVQNPAIANFRDDLPGLEAVSVNFWGNQGLVHLYDSSGDIYHDLEPGQHGSMCFPINWTGGSEEFFVWSPNPEDGGMIDGWGRTVVRFPADGHPDMCNAVMDLTGDCRDEVVVWDPYELWVYTQDDGPKEGNLYKPVRNPLYNYSNYQTTVSLPGWSKER